ncbi:cytochrome P450 [Modestobacter sp. L9-4]|uniref:cytochrome P450 n=1 Tax=Modestobacter sp. L9-4 TaxID=2851567 RepID=UPI001C7540AD|nr:cytochrome P450 [Modestobacter sp. L9-4]QXG76786.1 cytochrome P450 [Modestobacter sp. L9-4]
MTTTTAPPVRTAPRSRLPHLVQRGATLVDRRATLTALRRRHGATFAVPLPLLGDVVVVSDPADVRTLFRSGPDVVDAQDPNLGLLLGTGSLFAQRGATHAARRRLLAPPFHGRRIATHEQIVVEATEAELAQRPLGAAFPVLPSTMRITLDVVLRAVFGAEGEDLDELREVLPRWVELGSRLFVLPVPRWDLGGRAPWGRLRVFRERYEAVLDRLVARAAEDPGSRTDVLSMLLQSRYEDGSAMSRSELGDQLLAVLAAGHETTAITLAWALERLRRHPELLTRLTAALDDGDDALLDTLLDATIAEVQRTRPVVGLVPRQVTAASLELGSVTLQRGQTLVVPVELVHGDPTVFPDPERFDPDRFLGSRPVVGEWVAFGGGSRRCIGAAFAQMEMRVVLRTLLRRHVLVPTDAPDERWRFRGVAYAPARGGEVVLLPRS